MIGEIIPESCIHLCEEPDQGRQAGHPLDAVVVPSFPSERSAPATECPGLQPGQPLAQTRPAAAGQALVAHESPAAAGENRRPAGEACQVLLAPAGGRASDPAAVRRHVAEDLGAAGAGRLTRSRVQRSLAKKGHTCGAVSEKCPESSGSSRFPVERGPRLTGVGSRITCAEEMGSIRVSQRYFGAFRCFSWVI